MHPPCFDSQQQWDEWYRAAIATQAFRRFAFCADCTPEFMGRMLKAKRCIRPDVHFRLTSDLELEGWAPLKPSDYARKLMREAGFA